MAEPVDSDLQVNSRLLVPAGELGWRFSRSGGPGGQGVNTTDSRVELSVDLNTLSTLTDFQRARLLLRLE
ncbi:MAG: aminoacyl-tRNA hydrolase, partial [Mycobacteriaceae bacterium]